LTNNLYINKKDEKCQKLNFVYHLKKSFFLLLLLLIFQILLTYENVLMQWTSIPTIPCGICRHSALIWQKNDILYLILTDGRFCLNTSNYVLKFNTAPLYYINLVPFLNFPTPFIIYCAGWRRSNSKAFFIGGENGLPSQKFFLQSFRCFIYNEDIPLLDSINIKTARATYIQVDGVYIYLKNPKIYKFKEDIYSYLPTIN